MNTTFFAFTLGFAALITVLLLIRLRNIERTADDLAVELLHLRQQLTQSIASRDEAQAQREALFDVTSDPAVFIDNEHRVTALNAAAHTLGVFEIGRSLIESTRSFEIDLLAEETFADSLDLPRDFLLGSRLFRGRAALLGGNIGAVIVLHDISELTRLGRARRDFVANIGHELRTPLTAIRLLLDSTRATAQRSGIELPAAITRTLDQIDDQTATLTQMTQEISDLAQIESGQMPMRLVDTVLRDVVEPVLVRLSPQAEHAGLHLTSEIDSSFHVLVDPAQIQRVLSNLVHNAVKFTSKGGVTVTAQPEGTDWVRISVRDTGDGIPADELPRIFERFYKVDRARGRSGTGLGLAIAKHIVEAHGGRIWVTSTLGKGTAFWFTVASADRSD
jgi:two-component system phosphate regulon sensor histidine kinase PhoR